MGGSTPISVIIPTLNEQERIGRCLEHLTGVLPGSEILVVDGGSDDRTLAVASTYAAAGVRTAVAGRSRGAQMNAGALLAANDVLLFHHADVLLPGDAQRWIEETLADPGVVAGAFRTLTIAETLPSILGPFLRLADLRSRYTRLPYGDQALFVRRSVYHRAGGFADIPLMEDLDLARRLRREGTIRTVPVCVKVSPRRFLARPVSSAITMSLFPLLFRMGVSPWLLARLYGNPR
jgi:rSAM/selenodomain-associated transferase 2